LVALGRIDAVPEWAEWYEPRLSDAPEARSLIDATAWREALGDIRRVGDWSAFFHRELAEQPWADVIEAWVPRLAPGIMAGATHGLIRTAHAVRGLDREATPQRLHEVGEGLGYWAARYQTLPTAALDQSGPYLPVAGAIAAIPRVASAGRGVIFDAVKAIEPDAFAPVINLVEVQGNVDSLLSQITRAFVRQYLANAPAASIAFIHTVTTPSALRILAPHLSETTLQSSVRYAWQSCAAIYSAYSTMPAPRTDTSEPAAFDAADLIDQAVISRDEHAIKFTEACLREYAIIPDAAFIQAARDAVVRLRQ
jgi:Questin oxidase-like